MKRSGWQALHVPPGLRAGFWATIGASMKGAL